MTETTVKLAPMEQAMLWERMSGERLSDAEWQRLLDGGEFNPPSDAEQACSRCGRVILAGGCPYGDTACPQFPQESQEQDDA